MLQPRRISLLAALLIAGVMLARAVHAQDEISVRRYPLGTQGVLLLKVPSPWIDKRTAGSGGIQTINFGSAGDPRFILTLEAFAMIAAQATPDLHREVELLLNDVRAQAVETRIPVVEFNARSGPGYYFAVTDIAAKPGGFEYMDRGLVEVDGLVLKFTLLTNDAREDIRAQALTLLGAAVFQPAGRR